MVAFGANETPVVRRLVIDAVAGEDAADEIVGLGVVCVWVEVCGLEVILAGVEGAVGEVCEGFGGGGRGIGGVEGDILLLLLSLLREDCGDVLMEEHYFEG